MHPKYINNCRVCGSDNMAEVIDLGEQYLQGSFYKKGYVDPPRRKLPTKLIRCDVTSGGNACGLVQLAHTFPPDVLYANYWYRSGTNQTMRQHLAGIVKSATEIVNNSENSLRVLDIGCNDGTLLSNYPENSELFGIDPSDIARSISFPLTLINNIFPSEFTSQALGNKSFDIITSIAMFYDLNDPIEFSKGIKSILKENGVWILEMSYMPLMLLQNSFDTICHEHIEYYSLAVLEYIFNKAGLRIFKAEINDINGGSIRCYVCHSGNISYGDNEEQSFIKQLRLREFEMELDTARPYDEFNRRIESLRSETRRLLYDIHRTGKRIHVYGASTKGNVLLQWYGLDRIIIEAAADRNSDKEGASTLGTEIPIISEEKSREIKPDYYLVLPWHFKKEFLEREYETIKRGTNFIFPLPKLDVIDSENIDDAIALLNKQENEQKNILLDLLFNTLI
jgi:SAM-dependent methyltransferase